MQKASSGAVRLQESTEFRDADPPVGLPGFRFWPPPPSDQWGFAKLLKLWVSVLTSEIGRAAPASGAAGKGRSEAQRYSEERGAPGKRGFSTGNEKRHEESKDEIRNGLDGEGLWEDLEAPGGHWVNWAWRALWSSAGGAKLNAGAPCRAGKASSPST